MTWNEVRFENGRMMSHHRAPSGRVHEEDRNGRF